MSAFHEVLFCAKQHSGFAATSQSFSMSSET